MFSKNLPKVAIIGLPNTGKSSLFNRLVGINEAIVSPIPGTTVDRNEGKVRWNGFEFVVVDTAGLGKIDLPVDLQIDQAISEARLIILVTTLNLPQHEIRKKLGDKPHIVVVNKIDDFSKAPDMKNTINISALHGKNINTLLDEIIKQLSKVVRLTSQVESAKWQPKIAIVGRPNVGKSTLLNYLIGENRSIVAQSPGTTRDRLKAAWENAVLVDTAGIRRKSHITGTIERQAALKTLLSIRDAKIVLVLIDSTEGLTQQDLKIIRAAINQHKKVIVVFNKADLAPPQITRFRFIEKLPTIAISARDGTNVETLIEMMRTLIQADQVAIKPQKPGQ